MNPYSPEALRASMTIWLCCWDTEIPDEEIVKAIKIADDIDDLPHDIIVDYISHNRPRKVAEIIISTAIYLTGKTF